MTKLTTLRQFYCDRMDSSGLYPTQARKNFVTALNRFRDFLGRDAVFADVNYETYRAWHAHLSTRVATHAMRQLVYRIRKIARIAQQAGLMGQVVFGVAGRPKCVPCWQAPSGPPLPRDDVRTVQELLVHFYIPLRLATRADNTKRLYFGTIRRFAKFLGREPLLSDLSDETVSRFLATVVADGRSVHTATKHRDQLCALWNFAARKRFVQEFPDVTRPIGPTRAPRAWLAPELDRLWEALANVQGEIAGIPAAAWWLALHAVIWNSGERIGAILALRWENVDLDSGWFTSLAENRKGRTADKMFRLGSSAVAALERIEQPPRDLVFPWPLDPHSLYAKYGAILRGAGLPDDAKSKFHRMRKSVASHYEAIHPGAATALLGHSCRKVTLAYLDQRLVVSVQPADVLFTPGRTGGAA